MTEKKRDVEIRVFLLETPMLYNDALPHTLVSFVKNK